MNHAVVITGGGFGGCCAAIASARNGAKTLLIERYGSLGGMATAGLVNPFMTYFAGKKQIILGIFNEILSQLDTRGALLENKRGFDEEILKFILDDMMLSSGVDVLFHTQCINAKVENNKIVVAEIFNKSGKSFVESKVFVDSTGDADLASFAGCVVEIGRKEDNEVQPMTLCFRLANVDTTKIPNQKDIVGQYLNAKKQGLISCPRENIMWFIYPRNGDLHFNTTRAIHVNGTKGDDVSKAEQVARKQILEIVSFLKNQIPGFENAYIEKIATQIGVRETRRIIGEYVLTEDDVLQARKFDDGIANGSYNIDIHNPIGEGTVLKRLKPGEWYQIPYRCLVPKNIDNLLIGCRAISSTHEAHSSLRIMPIVAAIGEAAGTAAALCVKENTIPRNLNTTKLCETLKSQGAL